ncbi:MAG: 4-(cytidine 5'-diphospho)-2-C-methyl-D-erythritol kinase [Gammaproteobacteria bacterium]|nr:MAG: 4-(cytidine 5'-diphospho)-2-C-methyl-D-erythritol kinase [Gammaproteobacteria bacterium]
MVSDRSPDLPWPAPAKLNLFLHITGRRADGYHDLQTVFQLLDVGDDLHFSVRDDGRIVRLRPLDGIADESDLTLRAARLLQVETGTRFGAGIELVKRLPLGGGLGGGSSDAATTLVALNALWDTGLTLEELAVLGQRLGADVPVFVHGQSAWAEGVGERLTPLALTPRWYLVLVPDCHVATPEIFNAPELTRDSKPITIPDFLAGRGRNDCEPIVAKRYPEVAEALRRLDGAGRMSGTGACVFAAFDDAAAAQRALPTGWRGFVARGVDRSPLLDRLDAAGGGNGITGA